MLNYRDNSLTNDLFNLKKFVKFFEFFNLKKFPDKIPIKIHHQLCKYVDNGVINGFNFMEKNEKNLKKIKNIKMCVIEVLGHYADQ